MISTTKCRIWHTCARGQATLVSETSLLHLATVTVRIPTPSKSLILICSTLVQHFQMYLYLLSVPLLLNVCSFVSHHIVVDCGVHRGGGGEFPCHRGRRQVSGCISRGCETSTGHCGPTTQLYAHRRFPGCEWILSIIATVMSLHSMC